MGHFPSGIGAASSLALSVGPWKDSGEDGVITGAGYLRSPCVPTLSTDQLGSTEGVRWALEFVLQIVGWSTLALGGGSRFLLANPGSAAMIGSTPLAVAVILGSAVLIWVTRRSH